MKLSTRILAVILVLLTCFSFLFETVLAADTAEAEPEERPVSLGETEETPLMTTLPEETEAVLPTASPAAATSAPDGSAAAENSAAPEATTEPSPPAGEENAAEDVSAPAVRESAAPAAEVPADTPAVKATAEPAAEDNGPDIVADGAATATATPAPTPSPEPTNLSAPALKSIKCSGKAVTITWKAVSGASKYCVFRKPDGSDHWYELGYTTSTSYTDKTAAYGKKYTYTVRCVTKDGSKYASPYDTTGLTITVPTLNSLNAPLAQEGKAISGGSWKKVSGSWYYYVDNAPVKNGLYKIDGGNYYFNSSGVMQTGWVKTTYKTSDGKSHDSWSFFASSGARKESGWGKSSGKWYYFVNGFTLVSCTYRISGSNYYFNANGAMQTGWVLYPALNDEGDTVNVYGWFYSSGARFENGWKKIYSVWYYFVDGAIVTDTVKKIGSYYYRFNSNGAMQTGWFAATYTDANGKARSGWQYYTSSGARAENGPYTIGSYYYYFIDSIMQTNGWIDADGGRYYADASGQLRTGWWQNNGYYYYFGLKGKLQTGWKVISGETYYFYDGTEKNGGPKYTMATNTTIDGYQIGSDGTVGSMSVKQRLLREAQNHTSSSDYLIVVDHYYCRMGVFQKASDGSWEYKYFWSCAPGTASTPTYTGVFRITADRGYYFDSGSVRCFWYSNFHNYQAIHSVLYYPGGGVADSRLGMRLSHGCVRIAYSNAKWVYDYVPTGTTVVVI